MRTSTSAILLAVVCGCSLETEVEPPSTSSAVLAAPMYQVAKLPSLGGTLSRGTAVNTRGAIAGWSNRSDGTRHAALWRNGVITDLLTLGGPSSTVAWPGLNDQGMVVGVSHTAEVDTLDEDWSCEAGGFLPQTTNLVCRGFVFSQGRMQELPTLGGNHGFAAGVNNGAGAPNGRAVAEFADELGVSERHLRRALERELGVSPVELAQTHRLLLAKRLLADTTLSMTHIAFASGFQSLRRFNSVFRERYRLSPSAVRRMPRARGSGAGGSATPEADRVSSSVRPDGGTLPFEACTFDVATFDSVPSHMSEPERALTEALRVLRPGGWLGIFDGDYSTTTVAIGEHDPLQQCVDAMMANSVNALTVDENGRPKRWPPRS